MKICLLSSSPKGKSSNTYTLTQKVIDKVREKEEVEITEFFPKEDFPAFCTGCYNCILRDENKCPHIKQIKPIYDAMFKADVIIFSSPVYVLNMNGQMKTLLDHFGYLFVIHRPRPEFNKKVALLVSTTAGAGLDYTIRNITHPLKHWGIGKILTIGIKMLAIDFESIDKKRLKRIDKQIDKTASKLYRTFKNKEKLKPPFMFSFLKTILKPMVRSYKKDNIDRMYWEQIGWL